MTAIDPRFAGQQADTVPGDLSDDEINLRAQQAAEATRLRLTQLRDLARLRAKEKAAKPADTSKPAKPSK